MPPVQMAAMKLGSPTISIPRLTLPRTWVMSFRSLRHLHRPLSNSYARLFSCDAANASVQREAIRSHNRLLQHCTFRGQWLLHYPKLLAIDSSEELHDAHVSGNH